MKKRLLFMAVACLAGMAAYAQWTAPELPTEASELTAGHKYQIMNAYQTAGDMFIGAGKGYNEWSTATTIMDNRDDAITYIIDYTTDEYGEGWTLVNEATDLYTFISGDGSNYDHLGWGEMHVDMKEQGHNHFGFEKQSDGSYHITATYKVEEEDEDTGETVVTAEYEGCWGWVFEDEDYPTAVWATLDPSVSSNNCNWILLDVTTYSARVDLYNALMNSLNYDGVDVSAPSAVYENANSTLEEIEAATEAVKKAINEALTKGASEDNPLDVTSLIGNADYTEGSLSPWQNTNGILVWSADGFPDGNCNLSEVNNYESWTYGFAGWQPSSSGGLADEDLYQNIGYMPAGMYMLTLSMVCQHGEDMPEGVFIYANDSQLEFKHDEAQWAQLVAANTVNQLIEHPQLTFRLQEDCDLTIGVKLVDTNCNWVYGSKWQMTYYGVTDKSEDYFNLQSVINEAKAYIDSEAYYYSAATEAELAAAIATAEAVLESDVLNSVYAAAAEELTEVLNVVKEEVTAYVNFNNYVETVESDRDSYDADGWDDIAATLSDLYYEVKEHYDMADLTADEINEYIDNYNTLLEGLLAENMPYATSDHPLDITLLYLQNPNLTEGSKDPWEGTTDVLVYNTDTYPNSDCNLWEQNNNVTYNRWLAAWVSSSGSLGDDDVHQTVNDLPAGSYIFSCMMVAQHSSDMPSGVYLYSNGFVETMTEMKHDATLWEQLVDAGTYNQLLEYPTHSFYHTGGDVTVGIRLENTNCNWVYASKFTLSYAGEDVNALYAAMMQMVDQASELDDEAMWVEEADYLLLSAIDAAYDCSETDQDAIIAAMEQLQTAIDYAKESISLMEELETKWVLYDDVLIGLVEGSGDQSYLELLEEIYDAIAEGYESNAQIEGFIADLATGYTQYVQYNVLDTSSEENPGDITLALINADFEGIDGGDYTEFWDTSIVGGTNSYNYEAYECYNNTSFRISQTVLGLAEGYYRVRFQGFYRPGSHATNADSLAVDPDYGQNVIFFAGSKMSTPVCNVITGGSTTALGVDGETSVEYNGETIYLPNTMASAADYFALDRYWNTLDVGVNEGESLEIGIYKNENISSDWTIWSGFELYYLGTTAPTAIESVYDNESVATAGKVAKTQYFSVDGTLKSHLTKGVNIIKSTFEDGTVNVQKVLVK